MRNFILLIIIATAGFSKSVTAQVAYWGFYVTMVDTSIIIRPQPNSGPPVFSVVGVNNLISQYPVTDLQANAIIDGPKRAEHFYI